MMEDAGNRSRGECNRGPNMRERGAGWRLFSPVRLGNGHVAILRLKKKCAVLLAMMIIGVGFT